jgi:hypothetical protein
VSQWSVDCGETGSHTALIVYIRPIYLIEFTRFYALYTGYRLPYYFLIPYYFLRYRPVWHLKWGGCMMS